MDELTVQRIVDNAVNSAVRPLLDRIEKQSDKIKDVVSMANTNRSEVESLLFEVALLKRERR